ncbi:glycosyltransferase [uncultured Selenomonas sp.]|uniref:glycosyltransferase n=1 Tax=uncultured Selenomonas sp. TaxID=159275 RepID=UPI0025F1B550|nr:glycosyltransferase [uncultured Selenomonas sp.]
METIYDIKLDADAAKLPLYRKGERFLQAGGSVDLGTYFNAFSLAKWLRYTMLEALALELHFTGTARVTLYGRSESGTQGIVSAVATDGWHWQAESEELAKLARTSVLLGVRLTALDGAVELTGGRWMGNFAATRDIRIGAAICTYRREEYLRRNLDVLETYCKAHPWLTVLVIDNGRTLGERHDGWLNILPNRNYGGSGGFTRGLIEQVAAGKNDYVLLMDDDIELETTALDRLIALCRHMKDERRMQMIGGAMLRMDAPTIQHENTGYWGLVRQHSIGRSRDLSDPAMLCENEREQDVQNRYAAWWFCCIPCAVILEQGYPLPVFLKGDDMEYGIRSGRPILTMNGIAVWHMAFAAKESPVVNYFSDRNMLILNALLSGGSRWRSAFVALARLGNRIRHRDSASIFLYERALRDYLRGLTEMTAVGSDALFDDVRRWHSAHSLVGSVCASLALCGRVFLHDTAIRSGYCTFRTERLTDAAFWRRFLGLADGEGHRSWN